jgi:Beta-lactamase
MTFATEGIRDLVDEARLRIRLERACAQQAKSRVTVGIFCCDACAIAGVGNGDSFGRPPTEDRSFVGCLAKPLTASLVSQGIEDGWIGLDQPVPKLLSRPETDGFDPFEGICVRHLLNHTHGLDLSALGQTPYRDDGYIDIQTLRSVAVRYRRLSRPGDLYSYSNSGSWIAAAILEEHFRIRYDEILLTRLLGPLGISPTIGLTSTPAFCPAVGGSLTLSVDELLMFLRWCMTGKHANAKLAIGRGVMPGTPIALPGLSIEHGICLGWKYYGDGWYGHNALLSTTSVVVRFHLEDQIGLVVTADNRSAAVTLARVFGRMLPEFRDLKLPRPLSGSELSRSEIEACLGTYANGDTLALITSDGSTRLILEIVDKSTDKKSAFFIRTNLQQCTQSAFMLEPNAMIFGTWIQFIRPSTIGYQYLWNGKELYRREAAPSSTHPASYS